ITGFWAAVRKKNGGPVYTGRVKSTHLFGGYMNERYRLAAGLAATLVLSACVSAQNGPIPHWTIRGGVQMPTTDPLRDINKNGYMLGFGLQLPGIPQLPAFDVWLNVDASRVTGNGSRLDMIAFSYDVTTLLSHGGFAPYVGAGI